MGKHQKDERRRAKKIMERKKKKREKNRKKKKERQNGRVGMRGKFKNAVCEQRSAENIEGGSR